MRWWEWQLQPERRLATDRRVQRLAGLGDSRSLLVDCPGQGMVRVGETLIFGHAIPVVVTISFQGMLVDVINIILP